MKTKINLMERGKSGEGEEQLMIQSIPHHVSNMGEAVLRYEDVWLPMEQTYWCLLMM